MHFSTIFTYCMTLPTRLTTLFPYTTLFRSPQLQVVKREILVMIPQSQAVKKEVQVMVLLPIQMDQIRVGSITAPHLLQVGIRSEEHTSELQSRGHLVCRLMLEKKNKKEL